MTRSTFVLSALFVGLLAAVLHQSVAATGANQELGSPERGNYSVSNVNGSVCLMALMGLQLNVSYSSVSQNKTVAAMINLQPNITTPSGSCDLDSATLQLSTDADKINLTFRFSLNTTSNKYHLSGLSLSAVLADMKEESPLSFRNDTLEYMWGTLGHSYMCRDKQTLTVTKDFSVQTFKLQVQPFGFTGGFGAADECQLDEDDMLIPIIVGAALAGLVLIVLVAYLIGRKRSHAGYQTI